MRHMPYVPAVAARRAAPAPRLGHRLLRALRSLRDGYRERRYAARVYRELDGLDDAVLRDIGAPRHVIPTIARRAGASARADGFSGGRAGRG